MGEKQIRLGVAGLGAGIPLIVIGAKKRPVSEAGLDGLPYAPTAVPELAIGSADPRPVTVNMPS